MELTLNRVKIIEDVRMIEADIVYNQGFRIVMYKFRTFIKERRIILIRFNHEELISPLNEQRYPKFLQYHRLENLVLAHFVLKSKSTCPLLWFYHVYLKPLIPNDYVTNGRVTIADLM